MNSTATALLAEADRLRRSGALAEAAEQYRRLLATDPASVDALFHLARMACQQGRIAEGIGLLHRALGVDPKRAAVHNLLGMALARLGRPDEALTSLDAAIACESRFADAHANRGDVLVELGRPAEAVASYDRALALDSTSFETWCNRGGALHDLRRYAEAIASFDRALALRPDAAEVHVNRGGALARLDRFEDAVAAYDRALMIRPDHAGTLADRAAVLARLKRYDEAIADSERTLAIDPGHPRVLGELAACALAVCDWTRIERLQARLAEGVTKGTLAISPFVMLGIRDDPGLLHDCARRYVACEVPTRPAIPHPQPKGRGARIRLAYLSADFRRHATAYLMAQLFERHDRSRFEVIAISFGPNERSEMRARLEHAFDRFVDVSDRSDRDVAALIQDLGIDIAVDLKGHTEGSRPGILAYRPAPVQVSYLGYPGTTGADFLDYVIGDSIVTPAAHQPYFSERIVELPECYQVNDSTRAIAPHAPPRARLGLPHDGFVFCCFNHAWKITAPVFDVWMHLLREVEGSVLWLFQTNDVASANLRRAAEARSVAPDRLVFAPLADLPDHLARLKQADLFLDTLPYNAHTTASDALWAGVPLLTCQGTSFASRVTASLLTAAGIPELITDSLPAYRERALTLARDRERLQAIRHKLADNRGACALFDTDRFRRHIEAAYQRMWDIRLCGENPRGFRVEPIEN